MAWVELRDFRNHQDLKLDVPAGVTAVVGPNAQGKTNLLEGIYYLCALESPRVSADLPLVRRGATSSFLRGEVESRAGRTLVEVEIRASGQNRALVNRSPVRRKRDLRRHVRAIFSGPDDLGVVEGDPEERRRFMDEAVKALWPAKEAASGDYERALRQRNRLLKEWPGAGEPAGLEAWDAELVATGSAVTQARAAAIGALSARAAAEFERLSGGGPEALAVEYRPSVPGVEVEAAFRALLRERRGDELLRRTTLVGPHRDDLALWIQGFAARGFASHGEAWGAALSLRLALGAAVSREIGEDPVMFLDDPFSALDPERRGRLAAGLRGWRQLLLAVPDPAQVPAAAVTWSLRAEGIVAD